MMAIPDAHRGATCHALIALTAPREDAARDLLGDERATAAVDWDWLVERAMAHRVAALVAARVARCGGTARLPDGAAARLDEVRGAAEHRATAAQRTLRELAAAFQEAGIPVFLLKGSILAELIYRDPVIRPFFDVDVLLRPDALPAAEALLRGWGYRMDGLWPLLGRRPSPPIGIEAAERIARRLYRRVLHNVPYAPSRGDERRPIELHWHIVPPWRLRLHEDALWIRTTTADVAGITVQTLDAEARLIHLAVHALESWFHGFKLLHLCDVAWTVTANAADYGDVWDLARAWGAAYHLELALRIADRLWSVPSARALLAGQRPSVALRAALRLAGEERVLVERNTGPGHPWLHRAAVELVWGIAVRGLRTKLRFSLARRIAAARWRLARWHAAAFARVHPAGKTHSRR